MHKLLLNNSNMCKLFFLCILLIYNKKIIIEVYHIYILLVHVVCQLNYTYLFQEE